MTKIYVGNVSWRATEDELREFFSQFGEVQSVTVVTDKETGRSRGFAFVEMEKDAARAAIEGADGRELGGRPLRVSEARERERDRSRPPRSRDRDRH